MTVFGFQTFAKNYWISIVNTNDQRLSRMAFVRLANFGDGIHSWNDDMPCISVHHKFISRTFSVRWTHKLRKLINKHQMDANVLKIKFP